MSLPATPSDGPWATISLCMIVRDCERPLREALQSVRPYMDELVVVDTGSLDGTREVARQFGARLFEFPWCDDFSAARNCSLEQATSDWIFWMDSDDVLPPESGEELRRLVAGCPGRDAAFWVNVEEVSVDPQGGTRMHGQLKLFPRHPQIRFRYRVHEQVAPAITKLGLPFQVSRAKVRHTGANRSPEEQERRLQRNLRLLQLDVAERPDEPFVLLNLGLAYLNVPDELPLAIEYLRRSLAGFRPQTATRINAYLGIASAHRRSRRLDLELQACLEALAEFPDDATLLLRAGALHEEQGNLDRAVECYRRILEKGEVHVSATHVPDIVGRTTIRLGQLYIRLNQRLRAERLWTDFLKQNPRHAAVRRALHQSYIQPCSITTQRPM